MKSLYLLLIASALTATTYAQKNLTLGANLGLLRSSAPINIKQAKGDWPALYASVQASLRSSKSEIGLRMAASQMTYVDKTIGDDGGRAGVARLSVIPTVFYNRIRERNRLTTYYGGNVGLMLGFNWDGYMTLRAPRGTSGGNQAGLTAGVQAGALLRISKRASIGAEAGLSYFATKEWAGPKVLYFYSYTGALSVRYSLLRK